MSERDDSAHTRDDALVEVEGMKKYFPVNSGLVDDLRVKLTSAEKQYVHAVDDIDLEVFPGEALGVAGESGCGKTTTGMTLVKLHEPTDGVIKFRGEDITDFEGDQMAEYRSNAQMIFQDPFESLNPRMTVYDTIAEPLEIHGISNKRARVARALEFAELKPPEHYMESYPHELSGGERQRVAIARAIVLDPDFIVADEPVSMLDVSLRAGVLSLLERMTDEFGLSIVYISHDLSLLRHMCDRIAIMYMGRIVEIGATEDVVDSPQHPYTKSLINAVPVPDPDTSRERVELEGEVGDAIEVPSGCRFKGRCEDYIGDVCDQVDPPLEAKRDTPGDRDVACHLYESAEGFDPESELARSGPAEGDEGVAAAQGDD